MLLVYASHKLLECNMLLQIVQKICVLISVKFYMFLKNFKIFCVLTSVAFYMLLKNFKFFCVLTSVEFYMLLKNFKIFCVLITVEFDRYLWFFNKDFLLQPFLLFVSFLSHKFKFRIIHTSPLFSINIF